MRRSKILIVEDEADIREVLAYNLDREGYAVLCAADGPEGLQTARREAPDVVLLDLLLPGLDGVEVCRKLKMDPTTRDIPVIMITAKGEETDVVLGLGVGADDYMTKPFSPRELIARVRAVLRRGPLKDEPGAGADVKLVREGLVVDPQRHEVQVEGRPVPFTATEFRLLHFLASHPGRVFTREQLVSRIISEGAAVTERTIDVHVRSLRKKLGARRDLIETIRGVGYRFNEERSETGA